MSFADSHGGLLKLKLGGHSLLFWGRHPCWVSSSAVRATKSPAFFLLLSKYWTGLQKQHVSSWLLPANNLKTAKVAWTSPLSTPNPLVTNLPSADSNDSLKKNDKIQTIFLYTWNGLPGIQSVAKTSPSEPTVIFKSLLIIGHITILHSAMRKKKKASNKSPKVCSICPQFP